VDLAGRRLKLEFDDQRLPELREKIASICPEGSISYEIDWDSFDGDQAALENLWLVLEQPVYALESVGRDELGRQAMAESLRSVVVKNVPDADEVRASFEAVP
jgi:hypothetical protein